jgi:hypothetical protein
MLAGIAALIIADAKNEGTILTPDDVRAKLRKIAFDIGPDGHDESYGHGMPIFGKEENPDPPEEPPEEDEPDGKAKGGLPQANCIYWRMFGDFIEEAGQCLDDGKTMEASIAAGLRKLRAHKTAVNVMLNRK